MNAQDTEIDVPNWPDTKYSKVYAVTYDFTQNSIPDNLLAVEKNTLSKGVYVTSSPLRKSQIELIFSSITDSSLKGRPKKCAYEPHHAFIFYDDNDNIVGSLNICFQCAGWRAQPRGDFARYWDYRKLKALLKELGMDFHETNEGYTKAFKNKTS
jgi:hypothetical protein